MSRDESMTKTRPSYPNPLAVAETTELTKITGGPRHPAIPRLHEIRATGGRTFLRTIIDFHRPWTDIRGCHRHALRPYRPSLLAPRGQFGGAKTHAPRAPTGLVVVGEIPAHHNQGGIHPPAHPGLRPARRMAGILHHRGGPRNGGDHTRPTALPARLRSGRGRREAGPALLAAGAEPRRTAHRHRPRTPRRRVGPHGGTVVPNRREQARD